MAARITLKRLRETPEGNLPNVLWDHYLVLCDRDYVARQRAQKKGAKALPPWNDRRCLPRGLWYVARYFKFDGDVLNGGIAQFFFNHTPRQVGETLTILKAIGAKESAKVLSQAMELYKKHFAWNPKSTKRFRPESGSPETDKRVARFDKSRCNDDASRRDFALLEKHLRAHLGECLMPRSG